MNRSEAREAAEVMLAYADGKEIEVRKGDKWLPSYTVVFNWCDFRYRIKPQPKYRPFKDAEECWQEMQKHQPLGWLRDKDDTTVMCDVSDIKANRIGFSDGGCLFFNAVFDCYVFADGEPFGVKEEGV